MQRLLRRQHNARVAALEEERRTAQLEQENKLLRDRLDALDAKYASVPGLVEGRKDWHVLVGGERVDLQAIPAAEWIRTLEELPAFLWAYATEKVTQPNKVDHDSLEKVMDLAKRWIRASAVTLEGVNLDRLTLPEAEHAVTHISELNGVTATLRKWFQTQLGMAHATHCGEAVRRPAKRAAGRALN